MSGIQEAPDYFIFMKVGNHARENFESIIKRKMKEYETTGKMFWGYGGATCHPIHQIQPFSRQVMKKSGSIYIMMEYIHSNANPDLLPAEEFSIDGINWNPIPDGITVTGSRYAMILGEINPGELIINPSDYEVGIGKSRGKRADEYLVGRVDKGCFVKGDSNEHPQQDKKQIQISHQAELIDPYAVLLR